MLKNILKLKSAKELSKEAQKSIHGSGSGGCHVGCGFQAEGNHYFTSSVCALPNRTCRYNIHGNLVCLPR